MPDLIFEIFRNSGSPFPRFLVRPCVSSSSTSILNMNLVFVSLRRGLLLPLLVFGAFCTPNPLETTEAVNDQGHLERWQRRKDNQAREGQYQRYSSGGVLLEEASYRAGALQGERKYFSEQGQLESIERYENGQMHGKFQSFYNNGQLKIEQDFVNGTLTGMSIRYYPDGKVQENVQLKDNVENGPFVEYYENGALKTEGFYGPDAEGDGVEQGELKEYDTTGTLIRIADCKDGMCLTRWKQ